MTMDAAEARALEHFTKETAKHEMTVLHDDGLYRHVKFAEPGTNMYRFDLVTWPGYLAIVGDIQDRMFMRIEDMFDFFTSGPSINPDYWSEKLQATDGRRSVRVFSEALYVQAVEKWVREQLDDEEDEDRQAALKLAVSEQLLSGEPPHDERDAMTRLHEFECDGFHIYEPYEWGLTEYSTHFLVLLCDPVGRRAISEGQP